MQYHTVLIILGLGFKCVQCFWPPAYKVDLNDRKVFVIASDETDYEDKNEDEMIKAADLAEFKSLANDDEKFTSLHSHVELYNKRAARTATEFAQAFPNDFEPNLKEIHDFVEEAKPFITGFKNELDNYDFDDLEEQVFKAVKRKRNAVDQLGISKNPMEIKKSLFESDNKLNSITEPEEKMKLVEIREATNPTIEASQREDLVTPEKHFSATERSKELGHVTKNEGITTDKTDTEQQNDKEEYNYQELKSEYYEQVEYSKWDNKTLNYTDNGESEETAEDAIKKIVDFKMPKNCTKEELTQFGAKSLECLAYDYKNAKSEKNVKKILSRTWLVLRIWVCIYLCIAVPCWCQKGWCCCCFNCTFCNPKQSILIAKKYYAENPPGILTEYEKADGKSESNTTEFEPTLFELEAYERFESAIRNL